MKTLKSSGVRKSNLLYTSVWLTAYGYFEHGVHLKVVTLVIHGHGVGRCSEVPQSACGYQEDERDGRDHGHNDQRVHTGQPIAEQPGTTPHIHANDAEYGRIETRYGVVCESPPVRMDVLLEEVLCDCEKEVPQSADQKAGHRRQRQAAGKQVDEHQFPGATPVGDHTGSHHQAGHHHVQQLEQQLMEIPAWRLRLQALLAGGWVCGMCGWQVHWTRMRVWMEVLQELLIRHGYRSMAMRFLRPAGRQTALVRGQHLGFIGILQAFKVSSSTSSSFSCTTLLLC